MLLKTPKGINASFVSSYRLDINNIFGCYLDAQLYADEMFGHD